MTARPTTTPTDDALVSAARAAAGALRDGTGAGTALAWLSRHVAAVEHVVFPAMRRVRLTAVLAGEVERVRRLEHGMLLLHQALYGDGRGSRADLAAVSARVTHLLAEHLSGLTAISEELKLSLGEGQWTQVVAAYESALEQAPSRPHPHSPHGRIGERIAFPIASAVDRLLDALDARVTPPLPRQRTAEVSASSQA